MSAFQKQLLLSSLTVWFWYIDSIFLDMQASCQNKLELILILFSPVLIITLILYCREYLKNVFHLT